MMLTNRQHQAPPARHAVHGNLPHMGGGGWDGERAGPHHDLRVLYADFFLSSSTSVNSASTTSSLAASFAASRAASASACCLYIASPSFIEACASVLVLAL